MDEPVDPNSTDVNENPEVSILIFKKCLKPRMRVEQVSWNIRFLNNEFEAEKYPRRKESSRE